MSRTGLGIITKYVFINKIEMSIVGHECTSLNVLMFLVKNWTERVHLQPITITLPWKVITLMDWSGLQLEKGNVSYWTVLVWIPLMFLNRPTLFYLWLVNKSWTQHVIGWHTQTSSSWDGQWMANNHASSNNNCFKYGKWINDHRRCWIYHFGFTS